MPNAEPGGREGLLSVAGWCQGAEPGAHWAPPGVSQPPTSERRCKRAATRRPGGWTRPGAQPSPAPASVPAAPRNRAKAGSGRGLAFGAWPVGGAWCDGAWRSAGSRKGRGREPGGGRSLNARGVVCNGRGLRGELVTGWALSRGRGHEWAWPPFAAALWAWPGRRRCRGVVCVGVVSLVGVVSEGWSSALAL